MLISEIGKSHRGDITLQLYGDNGFTLIEILVAIVIMAIVLSTAVLKIPNHDERFWRNDLNHLVSALNAAQDETAMSGDVILVQVDSQGWRFYQSNLTSASAIAMGSGMSDRQISGSALMPDVYKPQLWNKPVIVEPIQLTLGGELVVGALTIPIAQDIRHATLLRNRNGRFTWAKA